MHTAAVWQQWNVTGRVVRIEAYKDRSVLAMAEPFLSLRPRSLSLSCLPMRGHTTHFLWCPQKGVWDCLALRFIHNVLVWCWQADELMPWISPHSLLRVIFLGH